MDEKEPFNSADITDAAQREMDKWHGKIDNLKTDLNYINSLKRYQKFLRDVAEQQCTSGYGPKFTEGLQKIMQAADLADFLTDDEERKYGINWETMWWGVRVKELLLKRSSEIEVMITEKEKKLINKFSELQKDKAEEGSA